ncbi:alkaline phosphatase D family protein [Nocardia tengchongensis]|uniref:alkaline phosphatase D family protein n=1 Tax=Nocardia tengchongensis TaxID=2055889 RepID=UPI003613CD37
MTTPNFDRREFLRVATIASGAATIAAVSVPSQARADDSASPDGKGDPRAVFQHGVASGDPLPDGIVLWTRVTPSDDAQPGSGLGRPAAVQWEIDTSAEFRSPIQKGVAHTGPERDHTVQVDVRGLEPGKRYFYRFRLGSTSSLVGRTKTAPHTSAALPGLRFGVVSCANYEFGYFGAYRHLAKRDDLDAILHLGDYIYEFASKVNTSDAKLVVRPHAPANECHTLADYRTRYGQYHSDPDLQALHASAPLIATWDDHEIAGNDWSGGSEDHDPATDGPWETRVAAAKQAYFEWIPIRTSFAGTTRRRLIFGQLAELNMLDLRSFRSKQVTADQLDLINDPSRTITGRAQMDWLKANLAEKTATWNFIGSSVMAMPWKVPNGKPTPGVNTDQWDGYGADQHELFSYLQDRDRRNTVFLSGDIHSSWAGTITSSGDSLPIATQLVVPAVTSNALGAFIPQSQAFLSGILKLNPAIKWGEIVSNGCGLLDITPSRVQMDWYRVDKTVANSGATWMNSMTVDATTLNLGNIATPI